MEISIIIGAVVGNLIFFFGALPLFGNKRYLKEKWNNLIGSSRDRFELPSITLKIVRGDKHNHLSPQQQRALLQESEEELGDLLAPYDHAIRNIKQDIALREQENTKKQELMELEERRKEIENQSIRLSKAMSQAGVSLEETVEGIERETTDGWIYDELMRQVNARQYYSSPHFLYNPTPPWGKTHRNIENSSMIRARERKILEGLEDIKERILREDKENNSDVAIRLSQDHKSLQKILKYHKPFTVKFEIATSLLYIILSELSYHQIVTDTTLGTHELVSYATNLDVKTVLEYISFTELRNELRRHKFSTDNKTNDSIIRFHHN